MSSDSDFGIPSPPKKKTKMAAAKTSMNSRETAMTRDEKKSRKINNKTGSKVKKSTTKNSASSYATAISPRPSLTGSSGLGVRRKSTSSWTPPGALPSTPTTLLAILGSHITKEISGALAGEGEHTWLA